MRRLLLLQVALSALAFGQQPIDVDGWNGAKFGMSPAQVQTAISSPVVRNDALSAILQKTHESLWEAPGPFTVARVPCKASFIFSADNKLTSVELGSVSSVDPAVLFNVLKEALIAKYGKPTDSQTDRAFWSFHSGSITLHKASITYRKSESDPLL